MSEAQQRAEATAAFYRQHGEVPSRVAFQKGWDAAVETAADEGAWLLAEVQRLREALRYFASKPHATWCNVNASAGGIGADATGKTVAHWSGRGVCCCDVGVADRALSQDGSESPVTIADMDQGATYLRTVAEEGTSNE